MPNMEGHRPREFRERFAEALRVRLHPNSTLHLKQLAAGISRSEHTISRWWHGESRPLAEDIDRLAAYFAKRGDHGFLAAVYNEPKIAADDVSDARLIQFFRKLMNDAANSATAGERTPDCNLWFNSDGGMATAPEGHENYVAAALGMPLSGNLIRYAIGVLGWIAVTLRADGQMAISHDGRRIAPLAAVRVCEWLHAYGDKASGVERSVHMDGRWIEAYHDTADLAAFALEKIAVIVRAPRRRWQVTQLPLGDVRKYPLLADLLRVHNETPDRVIHAAANKGAFTVSGVFSVDAEDVTTHHVATQFHDLEPHLIEGKNVLSRPDTDYAVMVWARILKAKKEGAILHELAGSVNNYFVHYVSLALAEPGNHGRVLTSSVILDAERIAA